MATQVVWENYKKTLDPYTRDKLLREYLPLVRNVASRMALGFPKSVEFNDLVNTGVIGLIEAFNNYDPARGVKFETYAVPRIRGAILDELRALDWVPRSTRAKSRNIEKAMTALENELGRSPSEKELAKQMNLPMKDLLSALGDVSCTSLLSLDELICREDDNRQVPRIETIQNEAVNNVLNDLERSELRAFLINSISSLSEQERLVVALYYYEELTLKEIGEVMLISESRVSQIHTKSVLRLRQMIRDKFAL
ncbi:MAG: FliA/WhiG family RNA polymerase sigma factor [candidate division Zixibacteria bacterium]|nr:FliA/WhiG family RNA polymerase sigma factor [candidate division Zixibacteria bacterium]